MHSSFHDKEIHTLIWIFSTAKPNYPGCQQSKIFASLDYYLLQSCYHDFHIRGRFPLQFHKKKSLTLYLFLFLVLDVKLQILQRNKRHYSGMLQSLTNWPHHRISGPVFVVSVFTPQSTVLFPQLPFYLLEDIHQCITSSIYLDPQKSSQSSEQELQRNIFRSLELLSKLHQCNHRLRKYQFPSGKILILFLRKSYSFLYQSLNCQL